MHYMKRRLKFAPSGCPARIVSLPAAAARPLGPPFRGRPRCRTRRPGRRAPRRHTDWRRALRPTGGTASGLWPRGRAAARWCRPCWRHEVERSGCFEDGLAVRGCAGPATARGRGRTASLPPLLHVVVVAVFVEHVHRSIRGPLDLPDGCSLWHVVLGAAPSTEAGAAGGRLGAGLDHAGHRAASADLWHHLRGGGGGVLGGGSAGWAG